MTSTTFTIGTSFDTTNGSYVEDGNKRIFTFNSNNSIALHYSNIQKVNVLTVGGGGSGGEKDSNPAKSGGGGGGGGGVNSTDVQINLNTSYDVIIGAGGARVGGSIKGNNQNGNNGKSTSCMGITSLGGNKGNFGSTYNGFYQVGAGGNSGDGTDYTGNGGNGSSWWSFECNYSGNFGVLVDGVYYGGGGGGGSYAGQTTCGNANDTTGNCYGRGGYGGEGGGGTRTGLTPPSCRTSVPISASNSYNGTPNSGGGGSGQNGDPNTANYSGAGGSGLVIITVYLIILSEITPVPTPSSNNTPNYIFNSTSIGTITYSSGVTSSVTTAIVGDNEITFNTIEDGTYNTLNDGTYNDITITVTDDAGNVSNVLNVSSFVIDTIAPILVEVTPVPTPTNDTTPNYIFNSTSIGTITYSGSAYSLTTQAVDGNNTITFETLDYGTYNDITITVTDDAGNVSNVLYVPEFIIEPVPILSEVIPVPTPTNDTTPYYTFSSTSIGTIIYSGSVSSNTMTTVIGNNPIIFNTLEYGTYNNVTITVTTPAGTESVPLDVTEFVIEPLTSSSQWNPELANESVEWTRAHTDCVDLNGATIDGQPMTREDLSEKRKAVIFQYKNNSAGFSKKQQYSRLARGIGRQRGQTFATQSDTYTNANTKVLPLNNTVLECPGVAKNWAYTNQNDTPGPLTTITNEPSVPLTNYIVRRTYLAGNNKWPQLGWKPGMNGFPVGKMGKK